MRPRKEDPATPTEPGGGQGGRSKTRPAPDDAQLHELEREADVEDPELSPDEEQPLKRVHEHDHRRHP